MAQKHHPQKSSRSDLQSPVVECPLPEAAPRIGESVQYLNVPGFEPLIQRLRKAPPAGILQFLPYPMTAASAVIALVVWLQTTLQPVHANNLELLKYCWMGIGAAAILWVVFRKYGQAIAAKLDPGGLKAWALSLQAGMLLLVVPAYLKVWHSDVVNQGWLVWGFLDKRWLVMLYLLGVATFVVLPPVLRRIVTGVRHVAQHRETVEAAPRHRRWLMIAAKTLLAIGMAWFYAGPPWHVEQATDVIDYHEQVHLGPLQAIDKGYIPDVGPAATPYGPGTQIFYYKFMKGTGQFNLVGFRQANACIHFLAALIFSVFVFNFLRLWQAPWVVWLAMTCSSFRMLTFRPGYHWLDGFYGWANELRYLGVLLLIALLPPLLRRWNGRFPSYPALLLGVLWGWFTWMSQENLAGGASGAAIILLLLWATGTANGMAIAQVTASIAAGCVLFWIPVFGYYIQHRAVADFVSNYWLFPSIVPKGFTNTTWASGTGDMYPVFLFTAPLLMLLAALTLCDFRFLRLRTRLTDKQSRMLAVTVALIVSFQSSLFRSDGYHVTNTLIALPLVVFLAWLDLPRWSAASVDWQWRLRLGFGVLVLVIYPFGETLIHPDRLVQPELTRLQDSKPRILPPEDSRVAFQRATRYYSGAPRMYEGDMPLREFLEDATEIHNLIGTRKTVVAKHPVLSQQFVYFIADLTPAPVLVDSLMIANRQMTENSARYFAVHVDECQAVIATHTKIQEADIFLRAHPHARTINRTFAGKPYVILLDN